MQIRFDLSFALALSMLSWMPFASASPDAAAGSLGSTCTPSDSELPRLSHKILARAKSRDAFFAAIRTFSDREGFAVRIAPSGPKGSYLIQLFREDIKLIFTNDFDSSEYSYSVYNTCQCVDAIPDSQLQEVAANLSRAVLAVHATRIIE